MENKINYLTKTPVLEQELDNLEEQLEAEFFSDNNPHVEISEVRNFAYGDVLNITTLISYLKLLKNEGATHVEIDYHPDHRTYNFTASKFRISTQEEIDGYNEKKKKYDKITLEMQEYQSKIETLRLELFK